MEKLEYEDDQIAIFYDKDQRAKSYYQCVPYRHIRDINHLRPRLDKLDQYQHLDNLLKNNNQMEIESYLKENLVSNEDDPSADLKLVKYMIEKGMEFMEKQFPNNPEGYRIGFHKPPHNS